MAVLFILNQKNSAIQHTEEMLLYTAYISLPLGKHILIGQTTVLELHNRAFLLLALQKPEFSNPT